MRGERERRRCDHHMHAARVAENQLSATSARNLVDLALAGGPYRSTVPAALALGPGAGDGAVR